MRQGGAPLPSPLRWLRRLLSQELPPEEVALARRRLPKETGELRPHYPDAFHH